jgi:hypothetical protein
MRTDKATKKVLKEEKLGKETRKEANVKETSGKPEYMVLYTGRQKPAYSVRK